METTSPNLDSAINHQLMILEQQLAAMCAVVELIEANLCSVLNGAATDALEAE
jgi:hypothetical protein